MSHYIVIPRYTYYTIENGNYSTAVYDKPDTFTFNIVNFPYILILHANIPAKPAYGVYISQLVGIGRICSHLHSLMIGTYRQLADTKTGLFGTRDCVWRLRGLMEALS